MGKYIMYLWAPNLEEFFHTQFPLSFIWRWQYVMVKKRRGWVGYVWASETIDDSILEENLWVRKHNFHLPYQIFKKEMPRISYKHIIVCFKEITSN